MSEVSPNICISLSKAPPSNILKVWSGLSTLLGSSTCAYPFPLLILLIKLPKRLVGARSLFFLRLISVSTVWEVLFFTNLIVFFITSQIIWAVSATGFSGE